MSYGMDKLGVDTHWQTDAGLFLLAPKGYLCVSFQFDCHPYIQIGVITRKTQKLEPIYHFFGPYDHFTEDFEKQ